MTEDQLNYLYVQACIAKQEEWEFLAAIQGIDLNKGGDSLSADAPIANPNAEIPMFGDPSQYEDMSKEERQAITKKMLGKHKSRFENALDQKVPIDTR